MTLPEDLAVEDFNSLKDTRGLLDDLAHYLNSCAGAGTDCGLEDDAEVLQRLNTLRDDLISQSAKLESRQDLYRALDDAVDMMTHAADSRKWVPAKIVKNPFKRGGGGGDDRDGDGDGDGEDENENENENGANGRVHDGAGADDEGADGGDPNSGNNENGADNSNTTGHESKEGDVSDNDSQGQGEGSGHFGGGNDIGGGSKMGGADANSNGNGIAGGPRGRTGAAFLVDVEDAVLDGQDHVVSVPRAFLRTGVEVACCEKGYFDVGSQVCLRKEKDAWSDGFQETITITSVNVPKTWNDVNVQVRLPHHIPLSQCSMIRDATL